MNNKAKFLIGVAMVAVLGGCQSRLENIGKAPDMSGLEVTDETMPEAKSIQVPMPEEIVAPMPKRADAASLWSTNNKGFFGDKRASKVGDILTVNIDISDKASLSNQSQRSRTNSENLATPLLLGYENKINAILPNIDKDEVPTESLVDLGSTSSSAGNGKVDRNEKINLKVAALVIDKLPNGNLVIAGRQEVRVNFELRELRVVGIIRPEDIASTNSIEYDKIAEARISYGGRGQITDVQQPRYGQQVLDVVLPW